MPLWCDRPRIPSSGPGLALVARMELTYVHMLSSTDENLELCGPASRLSFLLRRRSDKPTRATASAQATDKGPSQPGSCQTAKDDGGKPGVRFLARSKRGTRSRTASLLGGTRQRRRRFCSPWVGRDQGRRHCRWRSPDDRNWLSFHDRYHVTRDRLEPPPSFGHNINSALVLSHNLMERA